MMNQKLTEKEFNAFKELFKSMNTVLNLNKENDSNVGDFLHDEECDVNSLDSIVYDIETNDIYRAIKRFESGETKVTAIDSVNGSGFHVVEILHGLYDAVFGYVEENNQKVFYISEAKDSYNDETGEDETHFFIDEMPIGLHECVRTDSGWI